MGDIARCVCPKTVLERQARGFRALKQIEILENQKRLQKKSQLESYLVAGSLSCTDFDWDRWYYNGYLKCGRLDSFGWLSSWVPPTS